MAKNNIKHHIQWYVLWIYSGVLAVIGGVVFGASYAGLMKSAQYETILISNFVALIFFLAAGVLFILSIKSLITEAHVKALEVFYGKEREIKPETTKNDKSGNNTYGYLD